jgi:hypothetical protein
MNFTKLRNLCTPAQVYLFIEVVIILGMTYQNWDYDNYTLCVGDYSCGVGSKISLALSKLLYVAFWTFILNLMCNGGYKKFAWFLVLLPLTLFFVSLTMFMLFSGARYRGFEGFDNKPVDRLNKRNASPGDYATEQAIKSYDLGSIRQDYSYPDLSEDEQKDYEMPEGFDNKHVNKQAKKEGLSNRRKTKEGFWGLGQKKQSRERRRDGSCVMGGVTGANLSGYPSQFSNDYYAQV